MLLVTTTIRNSLPTCPSGSLHLIDLEKRIVLDGIEMPGPYEKKSTYLIPPPKFLPKDPNKRGGLRGLRGISVVDSETIAIANTVAIYTFGKNWELQQCIEHPSCAGIHDIVCRDGSFFVTSTLNDLVLEIDFHSKLKSCFYFREYPESLFFLPLNIQPSLNTTEIFQGTKDFRNPQNCRKLDNMAHINSICFIGKDDFLISLGFLRSLESKESSGNFVILRNKEGEVYPVLAMAGGLVPNHSLRMLRDNKLLFCDTNTGHVVQICLESHEIEKKIFVDKVFLRGLHILNEKMVVVGSGNCIFWIGLENNRVVDCLQISPNPKATVFDIVEISSDFSPFPAHLKSS